MERPSLQLTLGEHVFDWSYGLQMDIERLLPDAEQAISDVLGNSYTRNYLVRRMLTPSKKSITKVDDLIPDEDIDLDPDQQLELLDWIVEHLLYFFAKSAGNLARRGLAFKEALPQLAPLMPGSEISVS